MAIVMVTGATGGIGAALVERLRERGDQVYGVGRDRDRLAALGVHPVVADLTRPETLADTVPELPRLSALVHSAGVVTLGDVADTPYHVWQQHFAVNLGAAAELTRIMLPALRAAAQPGADRDQVPAAGDDPGTVTANSDAAAANGPTAGGGADAGGGAGAAGGGAGAAVGGPGRPGGQVVFVNSGAGLRANPGWSAYAASKFGLRALADSLRAEERSLRITSIHPGRTASGMQRSVREQEGGDYHPGRYIQPGTVADLILTALDTPWDAELIDLAVRYRL